MKRAYSRALWFGGAVAGLGAMALGAGAWHWHAESHRLLASLDTAQGDADTAFTADQLAGLPEPVVRYFRRVLKNDLRRIRHADLEQRAVFVTDPSTRTWRPLVARQHFTTRPHGFIWDARISMAPLMSVYVRDSYVNGLGGMRARMLGMVPLMNASPCRELNEGALQRYLAEAIWFPTALLPGHGVQWQPIDAHSALATLTDAANVVSLRFTFDESGDVRTIFTPARYREVHGAYVPTPWAVRCDDYETHEGMRIPVRCTVEWQLPEGSLPYWHGRVTRIAYRY